MAVSSSSVSQHRRTSLFWFQCLLGFIPLVLLPTLWSMKPAWVLGGRVLLALGLAALGYAVLVLALYLGESRGRRVTVSRSLLLGAAAYAPLLAVAIAIHPALSDVALLSAPLAGIALAWFAVALHAWPRTRLLLVGVLAVLAAGFEVGLATGRIKEPPPQPHTDQYEISSSVYELAVTAFRYVIPSPKTQQGGITTFGSRYLLASGDGDLFVFDRTADPRKLDLHRLALRVPLNAADFATAMKGTAVEVSWFRVADILAQPTARGIRLFASHHYWNAKDKCFVMRVSVTEGSEQDFLATPARLTWSTLFDTTPCLSVMAQGKAIVFGGIEDGGRLALLDEHRLLLSVGDHMLDGWTVGKAAAQDLTYSYGKVLLIDLDTHASRIYTYGHRNPQGLFVTAGGAVWETEHGPQGGDELNLLREGTNYGWPLATYGVEYGTHAWPLAKVPGSHEGFEQPYYSWIPSIGASSLLEVTSPKLEYWRGDLLVGALINRELWRLRVRDNRVVMVEHLPIGERIREIIQGQHGELVLWTDRESLMFIEPAAGDAVSGHSLFAICAGCHVPQPGQKDAVGPPLEGIVGRRVASVSGFAYSSAMKAAGGKWTRERLDAFLQSPSAVVPGSAMLFTGMTDAGSRRKLIDYLSSPGSKLGEMPQGTGE
jgi:aldose sugar dehydrogenase